MGKILMKHYKRHLRGWVILNANIPNDRGQAHGVLVSSADGRPTDRGSNPGTGYYFATTKRNNNLTRGIPLSPPKIILRGEIQGVTKFS